LTELPLSVASGTGLDLPSLAPDIDPGTDPWGSARSSAPSDFVVSGGSVFFTASDDVIGETEFDPGTPDRDLWNELAAVLAAASQACARLRGLRA
jgi:hypothetical protein